MNCDQQVMMPLQHLSPTFQPKTFTHPLSMWPSLPSFPEKRLMHAAMTHATGLHKDLRCGHTTQLPKNPTARSGVMLLAVSA